VVGGGTAGLITAIILKRFLNVNIDIIHSKEIGIVGVGEGSTEHFNDFMNFVGIDQFSIIKECDATFKSGIMFENWSKNNYLHNVADPFATQIAQYPYIYAKQIAENSQYINSKLLWKNQINSWYLNKNESPLFNQYHFNTHKLNLFLTKISKTLGINFIDDEIKDVVLKNNGEIKYIVGNKRYYYDFYIDATGFNRILMKKMNAKWISFGKYLKMKSAIVFATPDEEEYNLWTLAKAMDYGWRFKIPTWGRHGNGYIFDSDYITADQAKEELDKEFGFDVEISKEFKFDPGYLEKTWIKNCFAVGLSGSFIEPLEATSIGSSIQQAYLLMQKIINYSKKDIDLYNKSFVSIMENMRDFIILHYITKKDNTQFWIDAKNIELPEKLKNNLNIWKYKMPIKEDLLNQSDYSLFWENNFILVMHGLELFDNNSINKEYQKLHEGLKKRAEKIIEDQLILEKQIKTISHKKYIELTRNYF
jgi:flavin-dependent dehydrogenase